MAHNGGLERRLQALLLQPDSVFYGGWLSNMITICEATDDGARQLGQVLLEGHQVSALQLIDLRTLTATGDYQPLLDYVETDLYLQEIIITIEKESNDEVTSRFFRAMSRSTTIRRLEIRNVQYVPTDVMMHLLHGPMPLTNLTIDQAAISRNDQEMESTLFRKTTVIFRALKRNTSIRHLRMHQP